MRIISKHVVLSENRGEIAEIEAFKEGGFTRSGTAYFRGVLASAIEGDLLSLNGRIIKSDRGKSPPKNIHKGLFFPFQSAKQAPTVAKRGERIIQVVTPIMTISGTSILNIVITPFLAMRTLTGLGAVKRNDPKQTPLQEPPPVC